VSNVRYIHRRGQRIEVETLVETGAAPRKKVEPWVKVPLAWIAAAAKAAHSPATLVLVELLYASWRAKGSTFPPTEQQTESARCEPQSQSSGAARFGTTADNRRRAASPENADHYADCAVPVPRRIQMPVPRRAMVCSSAGHTIPFLLSSLLLLLRLRK